MAEFHNIVAYSLMLWALYSLLCIFSPRKPFSTRADAALSSFFCAMVAGVADAYPELGFLGSVNILVAGWAMYSLFCVFIPLKPFSTSGQAVLSFVISFLVVGAMNPEIGFPDSVISLIVLCAMYSLFCVFIPLKPFFTRGQAALSFVISSLAVAVMAYEVKLFSIVSVPAVLWGMYSLFRVFVPRKPLSTRGNAALSFVISGMVLWGADYFDSSMPLKAWTQLSAGSSSREEAGRTKADQPTYVESDFYWDSDTSKFKPQIVAIVNKIERENRNCNKIDTGSVMKSDRSKPGDPVFFATCNVGEGINNVFNVWFRPGDAETGKAFAAKQPIGRRAAINACEAEAKRAAVNPSTVEFSRVLDLAYIPYPTGRARILSTFTAKNAFNLESKYWINCLFEEATLIETTMGVNPD